MLDYVKRLSVMDNATRKSELKTILDELGIQYYSQIKNIDDRVIENIVVSYNKGAGKVTVVGAHFDIVDNSTGANDNASGVSILIELIKSLKSTPPKYALDIAFFDWEEIGGLGSTFYLDQVGKDSIEVMINLDICGVGETILTAPEKNISGSIMDNAFKHMSTKHDYLVVDKLPNGDERVFEEQNIPNISVCILPKEDVQPMIDIFKGDKDVKKEDFPSIIETMHGGINDNVDIVEAVALKKVFDFTYDLVMNLDY